MDLVVGATGHVGQKIALELRAKGRAVRAVVRGGTGRAEAKPLADAGIEIADADLTRPESLPPACNGIDTVVCTATSMPQGRDDGLCRVDHEGVLALISAAERASVQTFIYTSYSGRIHQESPLATAKRSCEQRLKAGTMQGVILRPSYFMEVWLSPVLGFDPAKGAARIYGSGEAKVSYISLHDVAAFAVAAAQKTGSGWDVVEMGGPEGVSQLDAVRVFENKLKKKFNLEFVSVNALQQQHKSTDPLQKTFAALMLAYAAGDEIPESRANAERYGIRLRSLEDHATAFQEGRVSAHAP